jgi:diguanylate cyclase (GGDEF)-like protein
MLWSRKSGAPSAEKPASIRAERPVSVPAASGPLDVDRALDTVASLVRRYGEHAFDVGEREAADIREECDRWAAKILGGGDGETPEGAPRRDFGGLRRFFEDQRHRESKHVQTSLSSLRGAIHTFARCVKSTVVDERSSDATIGGELAALADALSSNDAGRIRACSTELADVVTRSIDARRERHQAQIESLGEQLRSLKGELLSARERATIDALTRLYNRAAFDEHVARISDLGLLLGSPPCLLMIDVDSFKQLNDTHGHPAGDEVLRKVGECLLRNFLRKEDFVARYGGEEFAVVLMDVSQADARGLAERLRKAVRTLPVEHRGKALAVTVSVGLASLVPGEAAALWIERADAALYAAKSAGRDRVEVSPLPATFA